MAPDHTARGQQVSRRPPKTYPPANKRSGKVANCVSILKNGVKRIGTPKKKVRFSATLASFSFTGFSSQHANTFLNWAKLRSISIKKITKALVEKQKEAVKMELHRNGGIIPIITAKGRKPYYLCHKNGINDKGNVKKNRSTNFASDKEELETIKMQCKLCLKVAYSQDSRDKIGQNSTFICNDCFQKSTNLSITRSIAPVVRKAINTTKADLPQHNSLQVSNPHVVNESPSKLVVSNVRSLANLMMSDNCTLNNVCVKKIADKTVALPPPPIEKETVALPPPIELYSASPAMTSSSQKNGCDNANSDNKGANVISANDVKQVTVRLAEGIFTFVIDSTSDGNNSIMLLYSEVTGTPNNPILIDDN